MTATQLRNGARNTCLAIVTLLGLAACADNLNGPKDCVFAYSIAPGPITLAVGDSIAVHATPVANCGAPPLATWSVQDNTKATVRSTGSLTAIVRGVAAGTTLLDVANGDKTGFTTVQVQ